MNATLTFKEEAMLAISRLPSKATARKVRETIDTLAALRDSEKASEKGRVIAHEEVVQRFRAWRKK